MTTEREAPADDVADRALGSDAAPADPATRVVTSESLLAGASQLAIRHDRTLYFLRQTRYGKLILTK